MNCHPALLLPQVIGVLSIDKIGDKESATFWIDALEGPLMCSDERGAQGQISSTLIEICLWKPETLPTCANSAQGSAFHRSHLNSHRPACGCLVGDSDIVCIVQTRCRIIRRRTGSQTWFSKSRRAPQVLRTRFRDKCPLFQSIYYCY